VRASLGIPPEARRVIVFSQSAHLDWDWQRTFEHYYTSWVGPAFEAADALLSSQPGYFYSIAEVAFLKRHLDAHPERGGAFAQWYREGRLRIVGGGLTSPDMLLPAGESILRDFELGNAWLSTYFGHYAYIAHRPHVAWLPDDFGQSPTAPTLLRAAGYDAVAFARLPGNDRSTEIFGSRPPPPGTPARMLLDDKALDFLWRAPDGGTVFAHFMYPNYGIGDSLDNGLGIPGLPGTDFNGENATPDYVEGQIQRYLDLVGAASPTPYVFVPVGNDFQKPKPLLLQDLAMWNEDMYPLTGTWAAAATFEHYAQLVLFHRDALRTYELDGTPYFTGFYATKPALKRLHYRADRLLRAAEMLAVPSNVNVTDSIWRDLVPSNHHDYIPGTSLDDVYLTEQLPLLSGVAQKAEEALAARESELAATVDTTGNGTAVVVFNHHGAVRSGVVQVRLPQADASGLVAIDSGASSSPVQILSVDSQGSTVVFHAVDVPAHGRRTYHLRSGSASGGATAQDLGDGRIALSSGPVEAIVDATGITSLKVDGTERLRSGTHAAVPIYYIDGGGMYRLGAELVDAGCDWSESAEPPADEAMRIAERGPVRATVELTSTMHGMPVVRRMSLEAGERLVRVHFTGAAPERFSVALRFDLDASFVSAQMGAPYGVVTRPLEGAWRDAFHPAQDFFVPADGAGRVVFASPTGPPAWKASREGRVEQLVARNAPVEQCEAYGATGHDTAAAEVETFLFFPESASGCRAAEGLASAAEPLRAHVEPTHTGTATADGGLMSTDSAGAVVAVARSLGASTMLRVRRLDRALTSTRVTPGIPFGRASLTNALGTPGAALQTDDRSVVVPLDSDLVSVLLQ